MKNKILGILLAVLMVVSVFALSGCENLFPVESPTDENEESYRAIYQLYVEYAENNGEEPEDYEAWLEEIRGEDGKDGKDGKDGQDAVAPRLRINEKNNHWEISTDGGLTWKNLGVKATGNDGANGIDGKDGVSPHIGENGNWWIGSIDTEITAKGESGSKGEDGEDGITPQLRIVDGYWEVSYDNGETWMSLGVAATGPKGDKGDQGEKGEDGKDGQDGADGADGADGVGISSIKKISTEGLVDTYEITYTDGTKTTFTITNGADGVNGTDGTDGKDGVDGADGKDGKDGADGKDGQDGEDGKTPYIQDGYWYIDGVNTGVKAEGVDGEDLTACDHSFGEWIVVYNPTCESIGVNYRTCEKCNEVEHSYVEKLGHTLVDVYTIVDSCTDHKVMTMCSVCSSAHIDIREPHGHNYIDGNCEFCGVTSDEYFIFTLLDDDTYSIKAKDVNNMPSNVVIPSTHNGQPVTSIGSFAFYGCSSLTSVTIGDGVTSIGSYAFLDCSSLTSITIPDSVTSIGNGPFSSCSSLTSVTIPDSVTSIGSSAFSHCNSLTSVTIGDGVTSIGDWAFYGCSSLTSITVDENNQYYKSIDGNLYSKDGKTLIQYAIGKKDTAFIIPDSVESIGDYAFEYCTSLTSVTIGNGVTSIGNRAFCRCFSLYVIYNNSNFDLEIGSKENGYIAAYAKILISPEATIYANDEYTYLLTDDGFLFRYKNNKYELIAYTGGKETVMLPKNINDNPYDIYEMCGVVNVIIPDNVEFIGDYAFYPYSSLTSVTISDSVTSIGDWAFRYCSSLTSITVDENNQYYKSIDGNLYSKDGKTFIQYAIGKKDTAFVIPDSVTSIGEGAFRGCSSLTSINIPDSVTSIGDWAFSYCDSLTSINIPDSVTSIGDWAFSYCDSLTSINIPDSVTSIGNGPFSSCPSLTSINIPDSVTSIGNGPFSSCPSLTSITVGENNQYYKSIDGNLYTKDGTTLIQYAIGKEDTAFVIPDSVTSIGGGAFGDCDSLTSITIPDSVTSIGKSAFNHCDSLTVYYTGTEEEWAEIGIDNSYGLNDYLLNATIHYNYVPEE